MIEDWIEQNIDSRIKYTNNPNEIHICCPVCGDTRYRLYINLNSGVIYCHNCQFKGSIARLIQYIEGGSYKDAKELLKDINKYISLPIDIESPVMEKLVLSLYNIAIDKRPIPLPEEYQKILNTSNLMAKKAIKYLEKRGITKSQMELHNMGFCSIGEYRNRVIIPITQEGQVKFWVARSINPNDKLKEKSPSNKEYQYSKSEVIFNLDQAVKKFNSIVISEGIFDALSWGDIGVSLLGKVLYNAQLQLILNYKDKLTEGVYIALDADAVDSAIKIAEQLKNFFEVKLIDIPKEFDDPNKYLVTHSRSDMWKLIENARVYGELSPIYRKLHSL